MFTTTGALLLGLNKFKVDIISVANNKQIKEKLGSSLSEAVVGISLENKQSN